MIIKKGVAVSSGIAIGKCHLVDRNKVFIIGYTITDVEGEVKKLKAAVRYTSGVLDKLQASNISGKINTEIYDAYKLFLEDELFIGAAEAIIKNENVNAEYALKKVRDNFVRTMTSSDNEYMRDRLHDIEHIYQRMQRHMYNIKYDEFDEAGSDSIIISHDLTASDIGTIVKKGIKGFAVDTGSKTAHSAIMAKAAGIVCVVGLGDICSCVSDGDTIIIDGFLGQVVVAPDERTLTDYEKKMEDYNRFLASFSTVKDIRCFLKDGEAVHLFANIENNGEISLLNVHGLEGVGLYRTEFLYMNSSNMSEDEQYNIYSEAVSMLHGKPLVLRSFDLGGDKFSRYMPRHEEQNPALGLRAVRYCLKYDEFFKTQIRAILRAASLGDIRLLIPMVSSADEIMEVRKIIASEGAKLNAAGVSHKENIKIGIMIELPATAMCPEKFFPFADFFSIGTNDLIQYLLGIDRANEYVRHLYSPAHPSVIMLLSKIYSDLKSAGKDVSVCGEMAGDCHYIPMLIGMGYRSFSMNPRASYMVRKVVSVFEVSECEKLISDMLAAPTVQAAEEILIRFNNEKFKGIYM